MDEAMANPILERIQQRIWESLSDRYRGEETKDCPCCFSTGYITVDAPTDHPAFGQAFLCICKKDGSRQRKVAKLASNLGLPAHRQHCSFEWWDDQPSKMQVGKDQAWQISLAMAELGYADPKRIKRAGIVLWGLPGMGKSGFAAAIVKRRMLDFDENCMWIDAGEFLERIYMAQQRAWERDSAVIQGKDNNDYNNPFQFVSDVAQMPFIVIDDLGDMSRKTPITDYQRDRFYSLIRERYEYERPTVITTNLSLGEMEKQFGPRIARRLDESWVWAELTGLKVDTQIEAEQEGESYESEPAD